MRIIITESADVSLGLADGAARRVIGFEGEKKRKEEEKKKKKRARHTHGIPVEDAFGLLIVHVCNHRRRVSL